MLFLFYIGQWSSEPYPTCTENEILQCNIVQPLETAQKLQK